MSRMGSPGCRATNSRVLLPTAWMTRVMVPGGRIGIGDGQRDAFGVVAKRTMTNCPGCRIWRCAGRHVEPRDIRTELLPD